VKSVPQIIPFFLLALAFGLFIYRGFSPHAASESKRLAYLDFATVSNCVARFPANGFRVFDLAVLHLCFWRNVSLL
jgi:hypothetical protein